MPHIVTAELLERRVVVHVVGCGGTGSAVLPGLVKIHRAMRALGHPGGLDVTVWDADQVALSNVVRQNFFEADVGHPKAAVMVNRLNIAHGPAKLGWKARCEEFTAKAAKSLHSDFIVGCVDSKVSRREIHAAVQDVCDWTYWIDAGNESASGQVVVGQGGRRSGNLQDRLPLVSELFPEILEGDEDHAPSCSAAQSIRRQGVLTNQMAATWALAWIDAALRHGTVEWSGIFFSLPLGRVTSVAADPAAWKQLGYAPAAPADTEGDVAVAEAVPA